MVAVHLGAGAHRGGARAWPVGDSDVRRGLQRRARGAALVGVARRLDVWSAGGAGAAPARAAARDRTLGAGDGPGRRGGVTAGGAVPEQRVFRLGAGGPRGGGGGGGWPGLGGAGPAFRGAGPPGPFCPPRRGRGGEAVV